MVVLVTGLPGSGKSLKASQKIYDIAFNPKAKDYKSRKRIYTNLNKFDFEKCNAESDVEFYPYNFETLHESLTDLYMMRDQPDDVLLEYCDDKHLSDALFVIDECHNDFMKQDKVLIWWLSYHRHLFQDIMLLTQNKTLINSYYRHFPEFFYHAQPASKRLFNRSARYKVYSSFGHFKKDLVKTETVKIDKKYFSLYHSGEDQKPMNILRRYGLILLGLVMLTVVAFKLIQYKITGTSPLDDSPPVAKAASPEKLRDVNATSVNRVRHKDKDSERDVLVKISCDGFECWDEYLNVYSISRVFDFLQSDGNELLREEILFSSADVTIKRYFVRSSRSAVRHGLFRYFYSDTKEQEAFLGEG